MASIGIRVDAPFDEDDKHFGKQDPIPTGSKKNKRGKRREKSTAVDAMLEQFDPLDLLVGMAAIPNDFSNAGITIVGGVGSGAFQHGDGNSIGNTLCEYRMTITNLVQQVMKVITHASSAPELEIDAWVIRAHRLVSIHKFGHGAYAGQVRVLSPDEDGRRWEHGEWVHQSSISPLCLPARFQTTNVCLSANDPPVRIAQRSNGTLIRSDKDGDLVVAIGGDMENKRLCIFMLDAARLKLG